MNVNDNLVDLTPEEHYIAHQLLVKMNPGNYKLLCAALKMTRGRPNNKRYGWLKRRFSEQRRELSLGKKNTQYGTRWVCDKNGKASKISLNTPLPDGHIYGRHLYSKKCGYCGVLITTKTDLVYCSEECKRMKRSDACRIIDQNLEHMIEEFKKVKSITRGLNSYGIEGRRGNAHFSKKLKERGLGVLRRRNSYAVVG